MMFLLKQKAPSLAANIAWNTASNIYYLGTQWLITYIVIRVSGYESAGILSLAMTIATVCSSISMYSMRSYQSSDLSSAYSDEEYIKSRYFTIFIALLVCLFFSVVNGYGLVIIGCILAYMCFKLTEALSDVYQGIMQKGMRLDIAGINLIIRGSVSFLLFAAALVLTRDLFLSLCVLFASSLVLVLILDRTVALYMSNDRHAGRKAVIQLLRECFPLAAYGLLITLVGQAPRYYIEMILGSELLGIYTSIALPVVLIQALAGFMFNPLATPMADLILGNKVNELSRLISKVILLLVLLLVSSIVFCALFGEDFLIILYGASISGNAYLLIPLVITAILTALSWFLATVLTTLRRLFQIMWFAGIAAVAVLICSSPLISLFGLNGATFASIGSMGLFAFMCTIDTGKTLYKMIGNIGRK